METETLSEIKKYAKSAVNAFSNPLHTLSHLERVSENACWIAKVLGREDKLDINLLQAACYLHDIPFSIPKKYFFGAIGKHFFEKAFIKKYLPEILDRFKLNPEEKQILFGAILNHSFSIPYRRLHKNKDIYTKILQDADSIDYFSHEREGSLRRARGKSLYHFLLSTLSGQYFILGRKNIRLFLNFPNLLNYGDYPDR